MTRSSRSARQPPVVADPEAVDKAKRAAAAAGLSLQELADLLLDSGMVAKPPRDGVTEVYTMKDLGEKLIADMSTKRKSKRAEWFAKLSDVQKTSVIVTLRDQGFRTEVIAKDFDVEPRDVMRTWNAYAGQLGSQVVGMRLETIAGQMQMAAERAQEMASSSGDHSAYWRIEKEKVGILQSIGIVDRAAHKVEHTFKIDDERRAEIDALVALESKRSIRAQEIKQIESEIESDPVPDDVTEDYDEE